MFDGIKRILEARENLDLDDLRSCARVLSFYIDYSKPPQIRYYSTILELVRLFEYEIVNINHLKKLGDLYGLKK